MGADGGGGASGGGGAIGGGGARGGGGGGIPGENDSQLFYDGYKYTVTFEEIYETSSRQDLNLYFSPVLRRKAHNFK